MAAPVGRRMFLYNTVCEVVLWEYPGKAEALLDECEAVARNVQALLNAYDSTSELGRLNRNHRVGEPYVVTPELYRLLRRMDHFSAISNGAFDATVRPLVELWDFTAPNPRVPGAQALAAAMCRCGYHRVRYMDATHAVTFTAPGMCIDAGAVGKGYAVGKVAGVLRAQGVGSASLNFGGELYLLGGCARQSDKADWRVAVQRPAARRGEAVGTLALQNRAVATSGGYDRFFTIDGQQYCHILDPRTGHPVPRCMRGITVVCNDAVNAELLSTALFVLGPKAGAALASQFTGEPPAGWLVADEAGIEISNGLKPYFTPEKETDYP